MALTLAEIDEAIRNAIQGKTIRFGDREYTSQDIDQLLALRATVATTDPATQATHQSSRFAAVSKGV